MEIFLGTNYTQREVQIWGANPYLSHSCKSRQGTATFFTLTVRESAGLSTKCLSLYEKRIGQFCSKLWNSQTEETVNCHKLGQLLFHLIIRGTRWLLAPSPPSPYYGSLGTLDFCILASVQVPITKPQSCNLHSS